MKAILTVLGLLAWVLLAACQPPGTVSSPIAMQQQGQGGLAVQFDLGQTLSAGDFAILAAGEGLNLAAIASATVTVTSPLVEKPAVVTLTRQEIAQGWSYLFEDIPAGPAAVTLEVADSKGAKLFADAQEVTVSAGAVIPVDFTLTLAGNAPCSGQECAGSILVRVNAKTNCFASLALQPLAGRVGEPVQVSLDHLFGSPARISLDFGDKTTQEALSFPVSHIYAQPGRYPVTAELSGPQCKTPFSARAFVTIEGQGQTAQPATVLFRSYRNGNADIYRLGETGPQPLIQHEAWDGDAALAPDGQRLVFASNRLQAVNNLFLFQPGGPAPVPLTDQAKPASHPNWSPDGQQIVFALLEDPETMQLYTIQADGSSLRQLTDGPAIHREPAWSPGGKHIAFSSNRDGDYEIYILELATGQVSRLTTQPGPNFAPAWSPDGRQLVCAVYQQGNFEIVIMQADGSSPRTLAPHPADDVAPLWLPNGQIAFTSYRDGQTEVYAVNSDGTGLQNLTAHEGMDFTR